MRTFTCSCGNTVFFENTICVLCGSELGWCPVCRSITSLHAAQGGRFRCGNSSCGSMLVKCHNYAIENVCNRCCPAPDGPPAPAPLCDCCRFNDTIPDLSVPGNREKWARLEAAKRRLIYTLDLLQLPYGNQQDGITPALSFDFKADVVRQSQWWWSLGKEERVFTGHAGGKITINLREADTVEREKTRELFQEAHRTVIGHFRHEIGHYYWQMLIHGRCEDEFRAVFGDHENPTYADAQQRYYEHGPTPNWQAYYVSAYAAMHPWEDFAETFATYLDMVSVLDTAHNMGISEGLDLTRGNFSLIVSQYGKLGVVLNEMNRAMGLTDLVPEIITPTIVGKLTYVHELVSRARPRP